MSIGGLFFPNQVFEKGVDHHNTVMSALLKQEIGD